MTRRQEDPDVVGVTSSAVNPIELVFYISLPGIGKSYSNIKVAVWNKSYNSPSFEICDAVPIQTQTKPYHMIKTSLMIYPEFAYDIYVKVPGFLATMLSNYKYDPVTKMGAIIPDPLAGDINDDNFINAADFGLLSKTYGKNASQAGFNPNADFNRDGTVNVNDYGLFQRNYNKSGVV